MCLTGLRNVSFHGCRFFLHLSITPDYPSIRAFLRSERGGGDMAVEKFNAYQKMDKSLFYRMLQIKKFSLRQEGVGFLYNFPSIGMP